MVKSETEYKPHIEYKEYIESIKVLKIDEIERDSSKSKDEKSVNIEIPLKEDFILLTKQKYYEKMNNYKIICNDLLNLIVPIFIIVSVLSIVIYIIYII